MSQQRKNQNIIIIKQIPIKSKHLINAISRESLPDSTANRIIVTSTSPTVNSLSSNTSIISQQILHQSGTNIVSGIGTAMPVILSDTIPNTVTTLAVLTSNPGVSNDTAISPGLSVKSSSSVSTSDAETSTDMIASTSDLSDNQCDDKLLNGREARNRAEKNRRDKLNGSIQELSTMVPHVAESPRRVDKTAVLRFSAHGLRVNYVFGNVVKKPPPAKIQVADTLTRMLDSFHLSITCHGQIVLVSSSIEQHLGHCQTDLYGQNIMNITHPDDQALLRRQLIPTDLENLFDIQPEDESGELRARTQEEEDRIDERLKADIKVFVVRLARAGPRSEPTTYEAIRFNGSFRRADLAPRGAKSNNFPSGLQLIRRTRGRDDNIPLHSISGNDIVFVAMAQVLRPPNLNGRLMEANALEYRTRHLIDGRIIDCDQRIGIVAGYMKHEVTGLSPFTFMHQDDARWVIVALRQMYDSKSDYGESCYRLITRNNRFVYLQTKGFLEIDAETNKVHSFVCVNKLVSDEEGRRLVQEMKNKFSLIIDTKIPISSPLDIPASENPQQLEKAVLCLIQNLPKAGEDDENDPSTTNTRPIIEEKTVNTPVKNVALKATTDCMKRSPRTTPLALIAPEPSTVKSSIIKSVDVVGKNIRSGRMISSPQSVGANSPISPALSRDENSNDSTGTNCSFSHSRSSTFQRSCSNTTEGSPVQIKEEFFHSPQSRVPPLSHGNCKCFYEVSSPTSNCPNCQEFNSVASPSQSIKSPSTSSSKRPYPSNSAISSFESDPELIEESAKRKFIYREAAEREVHEIISHSFQQIEHPQRSVPNVSSKPREQCNRFFVPSTTEQLNEIFDELRDEEEPLTNRTDPGMLVNSPVIEQNPTHPPDDHLSQKNDLKPR